MNDEQIIQEVLDGDIEAFRWIVERHEHSIFGFVREMVRNLSDVEDIAQDVFLAAFKNLSSFDGRRAKFSTWLLTIAHNRCCNHLKRRRPQSGEMTDVICSLASPDAEAAQREMWKQLDEVLDKMTIEQRTAFVLSEIQRIPLAEIAAMEGIPLGTVKSRISRAKDHLKRALSAMYPIEENPIETRRP